MGTRAFKSQFRGVFDSLCSYVGTLDVASLADGAGSTSSVTVPGVALGDMVLAVSMGVSLAGITVTAYVSATDTVAVRFQNESGGTVDLASTTLRILVGKPNATAFQ